jgi:hypothetical protein
VKTTRIVLSAILILILLALGAGVQPLAIVRAASASEAGPAVYDCSGQQRDWAWLTERYSHVTFVPAAGYPKFQLTRIDCTTGPATLIVRVATAQGFPAPYQPVALAWPGIALEPDNPSSQIQRLSTAYRTILSPISLVSRTSTTGDVGFGLSSDWYIGQPNNYTGPGIVSVLSPSTYSDGIKGIGMLPYTVHEGPLLLTFTEVLAPPVITTPTPISPPAVTATPTSGIGPAPTATPTPGMGDLRETNDLLREIRDMLRGGFNSP